MSNFKIGITSLDITPPIGTDLCGYAKRSGGNVGVLDNLYLKVLMITTGNRRVVLISCDLIGLDNEFIVQVRNAAVKKFNLDYKSIMISCSHTHSGPATMRNIGIGTKDDEYLDHLVDKCLTGIEEALNSQQNTNVFFYKGKSDIGMNRRGIIKEGNIEPAMDPKGFVDEEVSVLVFYKENSKEIISVLFSFGCHPTVLDYSNNYVSSDFPGAACNFIKENLSGNVTPFFINGGAGNINPIFRGGFSEVNLAGKQLGESSLRAVEGSGYKIIPRLDYDIVNVVVPYLQILSEQDYKNIIEKNKENQSSELYNANIRWAFKYLRLAEESKIPSFLYSEIQVINIGNISIVGIPFEVFAETSYWIKQNTNMYTIIAGYTNGNYGYLPTSNEIIKGGYEVLEAYKYYDRPTCFSGEAENNIKHSSVKLVNKLISKRLRIYSYYI